MEGFRILHIYIYIECFFHFLKVCMPKMLEQQLWNLPKPKGVFSCSNFLLKNVQIKQFFGSQRETPTTELQIAKKTRVFFDFTTLGI